MRLLTLFAIAASLGAVGCASTPLIEAVRSHDLARVKTLVEAGADINKRSSMGPISSPIGHAARIGAYDIAAYLVTKGASDQQDTIDYAALYDQVDVVQAMMAAGAPMPARGLVNQSGKSLADKFGKRITVQGPTDVAAPVFLPRTVTSTSHGNLDDDAYNRMRAAAPLPPEKKELSSDIDAPSRRATERPDDFALVIGIEEYQSVPKADYGTRDAKTVRRHLEALGFPSRNIISLTGAEATGSKLRGYLEEWLPLNVKENSTLFVYYSGHGAPDVKSGDAYLVPWDGDPKFLKSTALPLTKLYSDLAKTKAKRIIVALDACFSGAGGRSVLAKGARPLVAKIADIAPTGGNMTVLAAASGDEITGSLDEQGHGMFTYYLFKALEADPKASAKSLFQYVMPRVQDDARRQNRVQTPVLAGVSLDEPLLR